MDAQPRGEAFPRGDARLAQNNDELMELRKQQTRRYLTLLITALLMVVSIYLVVWTEHKLEVFTGVLGLASNYIMEYFKSKPGE